MLIITSQGHESKSFEGGSGFQQLRIVGRNGVRLSRKSIKRSLTNHLVSFHLLLFQCGPAGTRLGLHLNRASQGNRAQCAAGDNWTLDNKFGTIGPVNKLIFQAKDPNVLVDRGAVTGTFNPFITVNVKLFQPP